MQPSPKQFGMMWPCEGVASTSPDSFFSAPKKLMWLKAFTVYVGAGFFDVFYFFRDTYEMWRDLVYDIYQFGTWT